MRHNANLHQDQSQAGAGVIEFGQDSRDPHFVAFLEPRVHFSVTACSRTPRVWNPRFNIPTGDTWTRVINLPLEAGHVGPEDPPRAI